MHVIDLSGIDLNNELCTLAIEHNCSAVLWYKHFGISVVLVNSPKLDVGKCYAATYESFYDLVGPHFSICKDISINMCLTWYEAKIKIDMECAVE